MTEIQKYSPFKFHNSFFKYTQLIRTKIYNGRYSSSPVHRSVNHVSPPDNESGANHVQTRRGQCPREHIILDEKLERLEFSRGILARNPADGGDKLLAKRARLCPGNEGTVAVSPATEILRLFARDGRGTCSSRTETPVLEEGGMNPGSRILEIGQQRIGWIKRRGKGEIKTAERPRTGRKSGELKRLRLFLPPETKDASSALWLGFRKLITIRGVGGLARNRIGDPGKNFIRRGRRSGASRSLLTGA